MLLNPKAPILITTNLDEFSRQQFKWPDAPFLIPIPIQPFTKQSGSTSPPQPARWPKWMRKREVAEYLSVSERTVDKWVKSSILPGPLNFGEHLKRWDRQALDEYLNKRQSNSGKNRNSVSSLLEDFKSHHAGENQ